MNEKKLQKVISTMGMHLIYTPKWEIIAVVIVYFYISCHKWSKAWPTKTYFLKWKKSNDQVFDVQAKGNYQNLEKLPQDISELLKEPSVCCAPMGREQGKILFLNVCIRYDLCLK